MPFANNYNGDSMAMLEETLRVLRLGGDLGSLLVINLKRLNNTIFACI
jgi:hypothetical protein